MIIGISGKISSGKDTIGKIIQRLDDIAFPAVSTVTTHNWKIKKFADSLKNVVCLLINCTREQLEDETFKKSPLSEEWWRYGLLREKTDKPIYLPSTFEDSRKLQSSFKGSTIFCQKTTPRDLLQLLGTDCGRNIIHPNIWVNSLMTEYKQSNNPNWIITDVRFPNELEAIIKRGGITIRVNRPAEKEELWSPTSANFHESETALDKASFKYVIENNGSITDLADKVNEILVYEKIIKPHNHKILCL